MSDVDINRIQQDIEQLQDQNAIDFQQWKRLGQEIEKLDEKIKTSDCRLNLLIKKIKADYENLKEKITEDIEKTKKDIETDYANLKQVMIDENAQAYLNNKIDTAVTEINSQLDTKANESEVVKKGYGTLNDFDEDTRRIIQGLGEGEINAVLGENNVTLDNMGMWFKDKSGNLLDLSSVLENKRISNWENATINSNWDGDGWYSLTAIPVKANENYGFIKDKSLWLDTLPTAVWYDINGVFLSNATANNKIFTAPQDGYFRACRQLVFPSDLQFKVINDITNYDYEEYGYKVKYLTKEETIDLINKSNNNTLYNYEKYAIKNEDNFNKELENIGEFISSFEEYTAIEGSSSIDGSISKYTEKSLKLVSGSKQSKIEKNLNLDIISGDNLSIWYKIDRADISKIYAVQFIYNFTDGTNVTDKLYNHALEGGWNIHKKYFSNSCKIKSIIVSINGLDGAVTNMYLDSIFKNHRNKPCVLLNFDNFHQNNFYAITYPLLKSYGFVGTVYLGGTNPLGNAYITKEQLDGLIAEGWDYSFYGKSGDYFDDNSSYEECYNTIKAQIDLRAREGVAMPVTWFCTSNRTSKVVSKVVKDLGFKLIRCGGGADGQILATGKDMFETDTSVIQTTTTTNNLSDVKRRIDKAINEGNAVSIFTHQLLEVSDDSNINCTIEVYTQMLDYLKTKVDAGLIEVITYKEFYERCVNSLREVSSIDFDRLLFRIEQLEKK